MKKLSNLQKSLLISLVVIVISVAMSYKKAKTVKYFGALTVIFIIALGFNYSMLRLGDHVAGKDEQPDEEEYKPKN